jgi:hypothetical protein
MGALIERARERIVQDQRRVAEVELDTVGPDGGVVDRTLTELGLGARILNSDAQATALERELERGRWNGFLGQAH